MPDYRQFTDAGYQQAQAEQAAQERQAKLDEYHRQQQVQQAAVANQNQQGFFPTLMDNIWMDDFQKGFIAPNATVFGREVPGASLIQSAYQQTVGDKVAGAATAVTKGYERWNQLASWTISALPGGQDTYSWDQANDITPGQSAQTWQSNMIDRGGLTGAIASSLPTAGFSLAQRVLDPNNPSNLQDFNVTDPNQRAAAFQSGGIGQVATGTNDALAQFFVDPLVLGGKGVKVFRFGSEAFGGFTGVTNARYTTANTARWWGTKVDNAVAHLDDTSLPQTVANDHARFIATHNADELSKYVLFDDYTNPHRDALVAVADSIDNERDALTFLGAIGGDGKYINQLRQEAPLRFDALARANRMSDIEHAVLNTPGGVVDPALLPEIEARYTTGQALIDDLKRKDQAFRSLVEAMDKTGNTPLLTSVGSRSRTLTRMSGLKAGGANGMKHSPEEIAQLVDEGRITEGEAASMMGTLAAGEGTSSALMEHVFQGASAFRKTRVWQWVGGQVASGYVTVRGLEMNTSKREWLAVLNDAKPLRNDRELRATVLDNWNKAILSNSPGAAMKAAKANEELIISRLAENVLKESGRPVDPEELANLRENLKHVYDQLDNARGATIESLQKNKRAYGVDPETGHLIVADPVLMSQLDTKIPILDMALMSKAARILSREGYRQNVSFKAAKTGAITKAALDEVMSLWKASVLMRLGYTQRNVLEGWMRTAAVLGTVPALTAAPRGFGRMVWSNRTWSGRGRQAARLRGEQNVIMDGIHALEEQRAALRAELDGVHAEAFGRWHDPAVVEANLRSTGKVASKKQVKAVRDEYLNNDTAYQSRVAAIRQDLADVQRQIDNQVTAMGAKQDEIRQFGKRRFGDDAAFAGANGDLYRGLASNEQTVERVLESRLGRIVQQKTEQGNWVKVRPNSSQYYQELEQAVVQFRNDKYARMALLSASVEDMVAAMRADSGYRNAMRLTSGKEAAGRATLIHNMVNEYLPTESARKVAARNLSLSGEKGFGPTKEELQSVLKDAGVELNPIHGKAVKNALTGPATLTEALHTPINKIFKYLGTIPESRLVRQPFYNEVWRKRAAFLGDLKKRELGVDVLPDDVVAGVQEAAHRFALNSVKETLYTIDRYSNMAHMLRFVAPFFPAWENSVKTWLRIIGEDPSVLVRGNMLWNLPNNLGMVVDKDGNKVEASPLDFLTGSSNKFIVMPQWFTKTFEPLAHVPLKIPQGSLNVISAGQEAWMPGFGPTVTYPVSAILASKPDEQEWLRRQLGDSLYQQFVPFGKASANPLDHFMPPWMKKTMQRVQGENSQEYLAVVDSMMQTAMVDWYASGGRPEDRPDPDTVRQKANDFYLFSIASSLALPVSTTRMSKYQLQLDQWNALKATPGLTYQQKVQSFLDKFGDQFLPLVVSTSSSVSKDLDPTIGTYNVLNENTKLVERLAMLGPETIGVIGSTAPLGQFDQGVYNWYLNSDIPGLPGDAWKTHMSPAEMQKKIDESAMWRDYQAAKAQRDDVLAKRGGLSINAKANADIKAQWTAFTDQWMVDKYGDAWVTGFNDYQSSQGKNLQAISTVLNDQKFMGSSAGRSQLWRNVSTYMQVRQSAIDAINRGENSKLVSDQFEAWSAQFQFSNIDFADFYDKYLANDKLTIGVTPVG